MPASPQRHILVVDDEPLLCEAIKMMLEFDGYAVETARSAKDALAILDKGNFDLVLTDFEMPIMKGDEMAAHIKARDPKQPVVLITAHAETLRAAGKPLKSIDLMIGKPFLWENLREAIAKVIPVVAEGRAEAN